MTPEFLSLTEPPAGVDPSAAAHWFVIRSGDVLVHADGRLPVASLKEIGLDGTEEPLFLGLLGGVPVWATGVASDTEPPGGMGFQPLMALSARLPESDWTMAGRALQLVEWQRTHRYCGRCAMPTVPSEGERARRCTACGLLAFPRLAPAIIALVERDGKALLANGRTFGVPMYSCLAGFVEPGESLEEAVHREIREEVGVRLGRVRYFRSQSWPFPHSLMVGFNAEWAAGEIDIDPVEIVDANWFGPDALPMIPPPLSIARTLIDDWLRRCGDRA